MTPDHKGCFNSRKLPPLCVEILFIRIAMWDIPDLVLKIFRVGSTAFSLIIFIIPYVTFKMNYLFLKSRKYGWT
jgi:hypothetical protein